MTTARAIAEESCAAGADAKVIPVDIAAAKALAIARPVEGTERLSLLDATGRVLARDFSGVLPLPPFNSSAMDDYAVSMTAFSGTGPWTLKVTARVAAGDDVDLVPFRLGEAVRILTGAPVPTGFDAVVMQEHCVHDNDHVTIARAPRRYENVRLAGEDVQIGQGLLAAGALLSAQKIALLAAQGAGEIDVVRKVRIGLLSTGNELREAGDRLGPGQIYNSNRFMLRAMMAPLPWAEVVDFGILSDRRDVLRDAFALAAGNCDVLVSTGGVSASEEDHVMGALADLGGGLEVLKVAMRPGKPVKIGKVGGSLFAGLPGNPNAALATFRLIALPAMRALAGLHSAAPYWSSGIAGFHYQKRVGRTEFVPVRETRRADPGHPVLEMLGRGSSASLSAMALADGLALLPPDHVEITPGMELLYERF